MPQTQPENGVEKRMKKKIFFYIFFIKINLILSAQSDGYSFLVGQFRHTVIGMMIKKGNSIKVMKIVPKSTSTSFCTVCKKCHLSKVLWSYL